MWLYILLGCLFSRMTGNMHFCTKSKKDFPHVTLVFEDGKWVEAHKMILAASSCLCLAENSKKNIRIHWSLWEEFRAISNTVGTFDFWRTLSLHLIQILYAIFYAFSSFWSSVSGGEPKACAGLKPCQCRQWTNCEKNLTATTVLKIHKLFHSGAKPKR